MCLVQTHNVTNIGEVNYIMISSKPKYFKISPEMTYINKDYYII